MISGNGARAGHSSRSAARSRPTRTSTTRAITPTGLTTGVGNASAIDRDLSLFARAGWIARLSSVDEAAVYGDLGRNWMQTGGYTETTSALNPFPATVSNGLDTLNVARLGGQLTHLFNGNIEANVSAAVAYGFGAGNGGPVSVNDFGPIAPNALPNTTWMEYGARIGYRFNDRLVIDAFVVGTAFGEVGDDGARRHRSALCVLRNSLAPAARRPVRLSANGSRAFCDLVELGEGAPPAPDSPSRDGRPSGRPMVGAGRAGGSRGRDNAARPVHWPGRPCEKSRQRIPSNRRAG